MFKRYHTPDCWRTKSRGHESASQVLESWRLKITIATEVDGRLISIMRHEIKYSITTVHTTLISHLLNTYAEAVCCTAGNSAVQVGICVRIWITKVVLAALLDCCRLRRVSPYARQEGRFKLTQLEVMLILAGWCSPCTSSFLLLAP